MFITYECARGECDNPARYQVDLNLPDKDLYCPTCGNTINTGELPGGGEWRRVEAGTGATGSANDPTVTTEDGADQ